MTSWRLAMRLDGLLGSCNTGAQLGRLGDPESNARKEYPM